MFGREGAAIPTIRVKVASGTVIYADESPQWDPLHAAYETHRINHSVEYARDGISTNWAESYFSRLRRSEIGVHHRIGTYLSSYANEMAWRQNFRRTSNGGQWAKITAAALAQPVSRTWAGYWQRKAA